MRGNLKQPPARAGPRSCSGEPSHDFVGEVTVGGCFQSGQIKRDPPEARHGKLSTPHGPAPRTHPLDPPQTHPTHPPTPPMGDGPNRWQYSNAKVCEKLFYISTCARFARALCFRSRMARFVLKQTLKESSTGFQEHKLIESSKNEYSKGL